jgi:hypothetical protein
MITSQATFKLPPVIAAQSQPDPLESLRSPQLNQSFNDKSLGRDSFAVSEFNDIALDDDNFSPIALTARPPILETVPAPLQGESISTSRTRSISFVVPPIVEFSSPKGHRKTASTTTIRSFHETNNTSLLLNRLDLHDTKGKARGSVDGQLKLQEEFARLHEKETKDLGVQEGVIDWG